MRQITTNVYTFDELSDKAKQKAIDNYNPFIDYIWDDAGRTVDEFCDLFGIKTGRSIFHIRSVDMRGEVAELTGARLTAYLWNNYGSQIFKPKYRKHVGGVHKFRNAEVRTPRSGKVYTCLRSTIFVESCCPLTGVCYDDDILSPIVKAMTVKPYNGTFYELLEECMHKLERSVESEIEYRHSDEAKREDLEETDYEFTEDGKMI